MGGATSDSFVHHSNPSWWSWPGRSCSRWPSGSTSQPASPRGDVLVRGGHGRGVRHHGRRRRPRGARRPLRAVDHGVRTGRGHRVRRWAPGRGDTLDPHQRHHGASCSPGAPSWGSWPGARRPATGPPWLLRGYRSAAAIFLVGFATLDTLSPPPARHRVLSFWSANVPTRPLGASVADWLGFPRVMGGLGVGAGTTALAICALIVVGVLTSTGRESPPVAWRHARRDR